MRALSLEQANTIIAATFATAKKERCRPMSAIVLDAGGRVKAFQKQDGASMMRFEVCYGKAYASLALGRPSKVGFQKGKEKAVVHAIDRQPRRLSAVSRRRRSAHSRPGRRGDGR